MDKRLGVLGGGQLGRMLIADASRMGLTVSVLDPASDAPAKQIANHSGHKQGAFTDPQAVLDFAKEVDVLTVEIEHVSVAALKQVEEQQIRVWPSSDVVGVIQDKYAQHRHLQSQGVAVAAFVAIDGADVATQIRQHAETFGLPLMIKSRTQAYDGRGNFLLRELGHFNDAIAALGRGKRPLYVEQIVPFVCEVAVMVVRAQDGQIRSYPAVETIHRDNICHIVFAPLRTGNRKTAADAQALAERAVEALGKGAVGVFGVEMFLLQDGALLVNEIAPRPHNSGHYTIEACATSQYENHLRAVLGLPLGSTAMMVPVAAMLNILGASDDLSDLDALRKATLTTEGASLHWYGKQGSRAGRKLGHITLVAKDAASLDERLSVLLKALPPAMQDAENPSVLSTAPAGPRIGIIMGSDSDLRVMRKAAEVLDQFGVDFEVKIVSAHRTPHLMVDYASSSVARGLSVIIAGAGGAAHLPGMVAALTTVPVIGVPVKGSSLDGVDSLHSIVQMPRGVPVATVAIDNATNAALLALRILSTSDASIAIQLADYATQMSNEVEAKRSKMSESGWRDYRAP